MKPSINQILIVMLLLVMTSCYTLSTHQTAKSLGEGNEEFRLSATLISAPKSSLNSNSNEYFYDSNMLCFPQLNYMRGITEKLDLGATFGFDKTGLNSKFQILGNKESSLAMASGLNVFSSILVTRHDLGDVTFIENGISYGLEVPLYFSYHPTDQIAVYSNPIFMMCKPINQISVVDKELPFFYNGNYKGISSGLQWSLPSVLPREDASLVLSVEFNWSAPLKGSDYIFSGGVGLIFRGFY